MATANTTSAISQANSIGIQDFLKILSSQLNNQDPLKPLDNQEFLSQIAQFSSLQQSQLLNDKIDQLLTTQSAAQSIGLLDKDIKFLATNATNGQTTPAKVTGITFDKGVASFTVKTTAGVILQGITFAQIISIGS